MLLALLLALPLALPLALRPDWPLGLHLPPAVCVWTERPLSELPLSWLLLSRLACKDT